MKNSSKIEICRVIDEKITKNAFFKDTFSLSLAQRTVSQSWCENTMCTWGSNFAIQPFGDKSIEPKI